MLQDTVETLKQTCFQGYPESAGCVQGSIDSRNSAIHSAYRISLRPSSLFEPRHPSLKVVMFDVAPEGTDKTVVKKVLKVWVLARAEEEREALIRPRPASRRTQTTVASPSATLTQRCTWIWIFV